MAHGPLTRSGSRSKKGHSLRLGAHGLDSAPVSLRGCSDRLSEPINFYSTVVSQRFSLSIPVLFCYLGCVQATTNEARTTIQVHEVGAIHCGQVGVPRLPVERTRQLRAPPG